MFEKPPAERAAAVSGTPVVAPTVVTLMRHLISRVDHDT
jgi:hypothetical protein